MLDQNTDRMWYVIGAIVIGAAIIAMGLNIFSDSFDSVDEQFASVMGVAGENIEGLEGESPVEWFTFNKINGGYEVTGFDVEFIESEFDGEYPTVISIPSKFKGEPVVKIADSSSSSSTFRNIHALKLPDTLVTVGSYAFYGRGNRLEELILPLGLKVIGDGAFRNNRIEYLDIPQSVEVIHYGAFRDNRIQTLNFRGDIKEIGGHSFQNNQLKSISIPDSVVLIGAAAFNGNILADDCATIYARNLNGDINYTKVVSYGGANKNVVIPEGVTTLGTYAYERNYLESVILPESLLNIGSFSLYFNDLSEIIIPENVRTISSGAFHVNKIQKVDLDTDSILQKNPSYPIFDPNVDVNIK